MPAGYPILLDLAGRLGVVVGAGPVATRKAAGLLDAGARVRVVAPEAGAELAGLAAAGDLDWSARAYEHGDLDGAALVVAATGAPEVNRRVAADARAAGIPVNVVDDPGDGTFTSLATLRRGDLVVAVGTSGRAPGLAGMLRRRLAGQLGPEWAALVELLGEVRERLPTAGDTGGWERLLAPVVLDRLRAGDVDGARERLELLLAERSVAKSR
jgi:precorrin-2 dehydrogenase